MAQRFVIKFPSSGTVQKRVEAVKIYRIILKTIAGSIDSVCHMWTLGHGKSVSRNKIWLLSATCLLLPACMQRGLLLSILSKRSLIPTNSAYNIAEA